MAENLLNFIVSNGSSHIVHGTESGPTKNSKRPSPANFTQNFTLVRSKKAGSRLTLQTTTPAPCTSRCFDQGLWPFTYSKGLSKSEQDIYYIFSDKFNLEEKTLTSDLQQSVACHFSAIFELSLERVGCGVASRGLVQLERQVLLDHQVRSVPVDEVSQLVAAGGEQVDLVDE